ncbi:hypothetical protein ACCAA_650023 [Candidatus Accumulibacter aalborgensis]|uniref:Uncharacterized protein n=1 Tax=Candidatus Accumulibacter aalborgensis TaxID=1860102 RepID=A0A1A8XWB4_9PROT|nr:hypothetical protein ACCAA_650023 [Candidatus Accumulibacter aalborgensis]
MARIPSPKAALVPGRQGGVRSWLAHFGRLPDIRQFLVHVPDVAKDAPGNGQFGRRSSTTLP